MSHRIAQVNELIVHELSSLLVSEVEFPADVLVTVVAAETSKDLRHTKVWVSVLPESRTGSVLKILRKNVGLLQFQLNKRLSLKPLPRIHFAYDPTEAHAAGIDALLDQIKE